ncbi:bifunctional ADP-dependent NAD(P)H-hydrate dehydratase/NAD(P)H-hydrate epimerase [Rhizobium oryziradicis]|uniref:Bifunctional NAD(P)H-hydrate repair enzyme n=1 Tax=Rhizobium oryziradicis TaxID=1867956 RepID=A0A1Q8ZPH5_9HYPH|nr:bifunctional ADP-dependent NAD(P)H-hydrate dehydratase/NAD(P)H-hydrate epimerase [Rhizobium oryziradicis]OLP43627.1 bifunctional ADP-dependent (S)-NAD(P)H-hydrate dehydratase/NAD(P)H-hydrate epimerase [Rhizobium oryziradicis]
MKQRSFYHLITPAAMAAVDRDAARSGIDSFGLMQKAGQAVCAAALRLFPEAVRMAVLCGPGNNGGDGYIAAEALRLSGVDVHVFHLGDPALLKGDASAAFLAYRGKVRPFAEYGPCSGDLVIDALFGAGLGRVLDQPVVEVIERINAASVPVIAVDLPSGLDGLTGQPRPVAMQACHTVTFMARKPGHLLMPGRALCGTVEVFDIGIPGRILDAHRGDVAINTPGIWGGSLPKLTGAAYKFTRGHLTVFSGPMSATGAARLSAMAGLKAGVGLVTLATPTEALCVNSAQTTAVMVKEVDDLPALHEYLKDKRMSAFVLGPGFGVGEKARAFTLALSDRKLVLDADGISSFHEKPEDLFEHFAKNAPTHLVMTPHEGEFTRLFPDLANEPALGKVQKALAAAKRANAIVVYKGADTVIASPDGRAFINENAPPWLATAGSGDVLAGIIGGLLAQGMPAFEAAAAGVYMHGEAALRVGEGLTAEDLAAAVRPLQMETAF